MTCSRFSGASAPIYRHGRTGRSETPLVRAADGDGVTRVHELAFRRELPLQALCELLPELYESGAEPEGQAPACIHQYKDEWLASNAAKSIADAVPRQRRHPVHRRLDLLLKEVQWATNDLYDGSHYSSGSDLRQWLERCVGAGLGVFDLVIVDEAHESRGSESGLSRLVKNVVVGSAVAPQLALTQPRWNWM